VRGLFRFAFLKDGDLGTHAHEKVAKPLAFFVGQIGPVLKPYLRGMSVFYRADHTFCLVMNFLTERY
jgi:hypothetical protein